MSTDCCRMSFIDGGLHYSRYVPRMIFVGISAFPFLLSSTFSSDVVLMVVGRSRQVLPIVASDSFTSHRTHQHALLAQLVQTRRLRNCKRGIKFIQLVGNNLICPKIIILFDLNVMLSTKQ